MMTISSPAGRRLARAHARLQALANAPKLPPREAYIEAVRERDEATDAVADELVAQGFHAMDGEG